MASSFSSSSPNPDCPIPVFPKAGAGVCDPARDNMKRSLSITMT
jgi:hypothetical protein